MPVKYFVSKEYRGREQAPDYSHETQAVLEIIKQMYATFNHHQNLYAIIANLNKQDAMADLVIITERGLGVVELKGYFGSITLRGTTWYAGPRSIPGNDRVGYRNPHEQVQLYTGTIRDTLMARPERSRRAEPWLPGKYHDWEQFQFGTAVCFTNEDVSFERFPVWHYKKSKKNPHIKEWEQFSILKPDEISGWVAALRFGVTKGHTDHFEAYRLTPKQVMRIVTELFEATKWTEIDKLMPTGKPYAYLLLKQGEEEIIPFGLDHEKMTIGRKASCDIAIPERFERVGREHAKIRRTMTGVLLENWRGKNGTFINGERITKAAYLKAGQQIALGGTPDKEHVCLLEFSLDPPKPRPTEVGTQLRKIRDGSS